MKRLLCLLSLILVLALTACDSTNTGAGGRPLPHPNGNVRVPGSDPLYSAKAQDDLKRLQKDLQEGGYLFGAANFGYVEEGKMPQEWANTMEPATCAAYGFIPEIPDEQIVGTIGCLLCLVPADPDATVSVNRIRWNRDGPRFEVEEVLYRSEIGHPLFLLAEDAAGRPGYSSLQVNIVGSSGSVDWYPTVVGGQLELASDRQGHNLGCDISMDGPGTGSDDMRWMLPTAEQLTCTVWDWNGQTEGGRWASGTLTLDGRASHAASLVWQYADDSVYREIYTGTWALSEEAIGERGYLLLRMELEGGSAYDSGRRAGYDSVFPVAVPADFASFRVLMIDEAGDGARLPFQTDSSPSAVLYPGAMG